MLFNRINTFVILLLSTLCLVNARSYRQPPISRATTVKDARIISWQVDPSAVHCTSSFTLLFRLAFPGDEPFDVRMALQPNHELIRSDAKIEYIDHDGEVVRTEPIIRQDHKIFKGEAYVRDEVTRQWKGCGWSRITILQDGDVPLFEGTFLKDEDVYHIKMLSTYMSHKEIDDAEVDGEVDDTMVVYRDSDRFISQTQQLVQRSIEGVVSADETNMSICAHDRLEFNMQQRKRQQRKRDSKAFGFDFFGRLVRRQGGDISGNIGSITQSQLASTIGDTNGCPQTREVALVAAAADCSYVTRYGNSTSTRTNIISIYNSASAVYESQLNITLGLSNIVMSDQECPTTASTSAAWNVACPSDFDMDNDLSTFSAWRGQRGNDGVALWTLLTGCSGGAEVGVAWLGMLCQYTAQTQGNTSVSGTNVVGATSSEWQVLAHELGHGFGAYHDCTSQTCGTTQTCCPLTTTTCDANQQYIMNPTTMDATNRFSLCTIGNICSGFADKTVSSTCLTTNNNVTLITAGECGNGIVEAGEECDCGGVQGCNGDPCCDPTTCKFTTGSVCDDSNDACCQSCQFAPSSKVCRTSINTLCDPVEYCPGNSSSCPPDVTTPDGTSCGSGLTCASGSCTSRDSQCEQAVNGSTGSCDDSSCVLSCSSATYGPNTCLVINQNFIDGTQCGFGLTGTCQNGQCEGQSTTAAIGNWIQQNKTLVIVLATVLGVLLLVCIASCIWRRLSYRKGSRQVVTGRQYRSTTRYPPPPPPRQPTLAYYPTNNYGPAPQNIVYNHAPPFGEPYAPPMRYDRGVHNDTRIQQPGEEWVRGADGAFYPPGQVTRPPRPANRNYWE